MSGAAMINSILVQQEAKMRKAKEAARKQREEDLKRYEQIKSIGLCNRQIKGAHVTRTQLTLMQS